MITRRQPEATVHLGVAVRTLKSPYRIEAANRTTSCPLSPSGPAAYEDLVVSGLIAFVGALGVAIGVFAPQRTFELSLGLLMLAFVAATVVSERRGRLRVATRRPDDQA